MFTPSDKRNPSKGSSCGAGFFKCEIDNLCIKESWTCDGFKDCRNGSDEADILCSMFYFVLFYAWLNMQGGKQWILKTSYLVYYIMVYHNTWLRLYFRQQNLQFDYRISMSKQTLYTEVMALRSKTWLHSRCRWKKLYWIM